MTDYRKQAEDVLCAIDTGAYEPDAIESALLAAHEAGRREGLEEAANYYGGCAGDLIAAYARALKERKP